LQQGAGGVSAAPDTDARAVLVAALISERRR
jgi:hypothetical protein